MSKRKPSLDRSTTETRGSQPAEIDISHGEPVWIGGDPCISLPAGHPAVTLHMADVRRAARWKAEAKRLRKVLVKIANAHPPAGRYVCGRVAAEALRTRRKP